METNSDNSIGNYQFVINGLSSLFDEAPTENELRTLSKCHELPVVFVEIDENDYAVIIDQTVVLRYDTYEKGFLSYVSAFSVFNMSWLTVMQVCSYNLHIYFSYLAFYVLTLSMLHFKGLETRNLQYYIRICKKCTTAKGMMSTCRRYTKFLAAKMDSETCRNLVIVPIILKS